MICWTSKSFKYGSITYWVPYRLPSHIRKALSLCILEIHEKHKNILKWPYYGLEIISIFLYNAIGSGYHMVYGYRPLYTVPMRCDNVIYRNCSSQEPFRCGKHFCNPPIVILRVNMGHRSAHLIKGPYQLCQSPSPYMYTKRWYRCSLPPVLCGSHRTLPKGYRRLRWLIQSGPFIAQIRWLLCVTCPACNYSFFFHDFMGFGLPDSVFPPG